MRTWTCLFLALTACGQGVSHDPSQNHPSGNAPICSSSTPCPSGQFCFNGICAFGCNSNGDCADDQYCDTDGDRLCHNKTVTTCPDTPCASSQTCVRGFCSTPPPATQCMPSPDGNDGCDATSICLEPDDEQAAKCYSFPACPEDGDCPTGLYGAVCNDGYVQSKGRICLTGLCHVVGDCPADWHCIKANAANVLGMCSNGSAGMPCTSQADCADGAECLGGGVPGLFGVCAGVPGGGGGGGGGGECMTSGLCFGSSECCDGYSCSDGECRGKAGVACDGNLDCETGLVCRLATRTCGTCAVSGESCTSSVECCDSISGCGFSDTCE